jgi:hypothetical protein
MHVSRRSRRLALAGSIAAVLVAAVTTLGAAQGATAMTSHHSARVAVTSGTHATGSGIVADGANSIAGDSIAGDKISGATSIAGDGGPGSVAAISGPMVAQSIAGD